MNESFAMSKSSKKKAIVLCVAVLTIVVCWHFIDYDAPRDVSYLFKSHPVVIAHRGGMALAPENTMAAFDNAVRLGHPFELDIHLTKDGKLAVIHADTVDKATDGAGAVEEMTMEELKKLDAGSKFSPKHAGERIPELGEVLDAFGGKVPIDIEVKCESKCDAAKIVDKLAEELKTRRLEKAVLVEAFNPFVLARLGKVAPEVARFQTMSDLDYRPDILWITKFALKHMLLNYIARPDGIMADRDMVDEAFVRKMKKRGYTVIVWTVDDESEAKKFLTMGVDGIVSNDPTKFAR
jgi:glycerophosphoryl diester phosphodiesterase